MVTNLYGTQIGMVHQPHSNNSDERCIRSTDYTKHFSDRCTSASQLRLEQYFDAVTELYENTFDDGGCPAGVLSC